MVYAPTSYNRTVYATPAVAGLASIRLGQSLRSFPRLIPAHLRGTKPYGFLYSAAQTVIYSRNGIPAMSHPILD